MTKQLMVMTMTVQALFFYVQHNNIHKEHSQLITIQHTIQGPRTNKKIYTGQHQQETTDRHENKPVEKNLGATMV